MSRLSEVAVVAKANMIAPAQGDHAVLRAAGVLRDWPDGRTAERVLS
jgi:hypothetical protein